MSCKLYYPIFIFNACFCFIWTNVVHNNSTEQIGIPTVNTTVTDVRRDWDKTQTDSLLFATKQKGLYKGNGEISNFSMKEFLFDWEKLSDDLLTG